MEPIRFALVGYGAWGSHHAQAIESVPDARLVAVVEHNEDNRQRAQARASGAKVFADLGAMLAAVDTDVVDVVLPSHLHHAVGIEALRAGKHVLLEKPLALDLRQCDDLVQAARQEAKLLAVEHEFRLSSLWGRVRQLIAAGEIGEPLYALIELWRNPYRLGAEGCATTCTASATGSWRSRSTFLTWPAGISRTWASRCRC